MSYSATAYRLLISCPSDVPESDLQIVERSVGRWNTLYGRPRGAVVVPSRWKTHSAAEHGDRPQASLNAQLVQDADIVLALFWYRIGSSTGQADSGTIEEIEEAHSNGAYVGILRCGRDIPQTADLSQLEKLRAFYDEVQEISYILDYATEAELGQHTDATLNWAIENLHSRAEVATGMISGSGATIWPRVESSEQVETDSKGRVRTRRRWYLVLTNTGTEPARDVQWRLEPESEGDVLPRVIDDERPLETLAPDGGDASYPLLLHMGIAPQARAVVSWEDDAGSHENSATLRFV